MEESASDLNARIAERARELRAGRGDCLAMQLDQPTLFHNPTRKPARYAVVVASELVAKR